MNHSKNSFKKPITFQLRLNDHKKLTKLALSRQRTRSELVRLIVEKEISLAEQSGELTSVISDPKHS